jgi:hypothetical protein
MKLMEDTIDGQRLPLRRRSLLYSTNDPRREPATSPKRHV